MARIGKEVSLCFVCLPCRFESILLLDLCFDDFILGDRAHDDTGKIHHRKTRIVHIRKLEAEIPERSVHVHYHYYEKDSAEISSVNKIEEEENDRDGDEEKEYARTLGTAGIKEEHERDPVDQALDLDGQVHQPVAFLFPEFADGEIDNGNGSHYCAEKRVTRHDGLPVYEVINTQVNAEWNDDCIDNDRKCKIHFHIPFIYMQKLPL